MQDVIGDRALQGQSWKLSIVAPCFNEAENIGELCSRVRGALEGKVPSYELIIVDDGSSDKSWEVLQAASSKDHRVRAIRLSRNFGQQAAFCAGLAVAQGDAVVTMDSDLQDPPELIPELVSRWLSGAEIVYTTRSKREHDTLSKRLFAKLFYSVIGRLTGLAIPQQGGEFRLMDKRVVQILSRMHDRQPFLRGMVAWTGFRKESVSYDRPPRFAGEAKFSFAKSLSLATDAIVSFSRIPLRAALPIGALFFTIGGVWSAALLVQIAFGSAVLLSQWVPALVILCCGVQLVFLGVIGEYLARNLEHAAGRPLYVIAEELNSNRAVLPVARTA